MTWLDFTRIILGFIAFSFVLGFLTAWWEDRKRRKDLNNPHEKD